MPFLYILYSKSHDSYYTGVCLDCLESRIEKHNSGAYGNKTYTSFTNDWILYLSIEVSAFDHAVRLERKIKSMKSKVFIQNLAKYEDLKKKIIDETTFSKKNKAPHNAGGLLNF
ncbi:MAG: GIY-YIG nuclease family protein [Saprospiraceae bacterium]|nr:GIY-YIG nuclease family protein [Saprospiraceae bacterium]